MGAFSAEIKTAEGKVYSITKVVAENKEGDLVRLAVDFGRETVKPLRFKWYLPEAGERVLVIGSPLGLEQTVSEGMFPQSVTPGDSFKSPLDSSGVQRESSRQYEG